MSGDIVVVFRNLWITDVVSLQSITAGTPSRSVLQDLTPASSVRMFAGGRRRIISTPQDTQTHPVVLNWVKDPDAVTLAGWRGNVLLLRDALGRRVWGTILKIQQDDVSQGLEFFHDLTFDFLVIDYSEGV